MKHAEIGPLLVFKLIGPGCAKLGLRISRLAALFLLFLVLSGSSARPIACAAEIVAIRADEFLDSIGANSAVSRRGEKLASTIEAAKYLGLRWFRVGYESGIPVADLIELHKQAGVRFSYGLMSGGTDIPRLLEGARQLAAADALLALEGNNEPNNWGVTYQGERGGRTNTWLPVAKLQKDLYRAVKNDPVLKDYPVWSLSENGAQTDNVGLQFLTVPKGAGTLMPDGTQYADYANCHNYMTHPSWAGLHDNQTWIAADPTSACKVDGLYGNYGLTWRRKYAGYSEADLLALPKVTTETGITIEGVITEQIQALFYLSVYLDQYKRGWKHTAIYLLRDRSDEGGNQTFGFYKPDYTPRLAATYLHNLTTILADKRSKTNPDKLSYAIPNQPATVHDLLLQKSDGRFELVVWNERFTGGSDEVTINLDRAFPSVNLFDPTVGAAPIQSTANASVVSLTLSNHPVIIEFSAEAAFGVPRMWEYSPPLISPEVRSTNVSRAQKDPTVVFDNGQWHVFMTVKLPGRSAIEYCSFTKWEDANASKRTILNVGDSDYFCAPQVFYFRPHQKWYLVYQVGMPGTDKMWVAYSTTADIADPQSWTQARPMLDGGKNDPRKVGGLDYWIICDHQRAYLFLTSLDGRMWRLWTRLEEFPRGFDHCELALQARIFEASHTYKLKGMDKYLTIIEENGRRHYKAYLADRLDGEWLPVADTAERPFAGWNNVRPAAGVEPWTDNVSHGELIRDGVDETLTVDPADLRFIFQGMWDQHKSGKEYGQFQWRIGMLTPVSTQTAIFPGAQWEEATPESQGMDAAKLKGAVDLLASTVGDDGAHELAIIRNGRLIWRGDKHIFITARDMARFGLLFLNQGNWNGRRLVSSKWVAEATRVQVPSSMPWAHAESNIDGRGVYGFNWWRNGLKPDGARKYPGAPEGMFWASGHNNNKCFVIPEWNMVIVRLGLDGQAKDEVWDQFLTRVGQAIVIPQAAAATLPSSIPRRPL